MKELFFTILLGFTCLNVFAQTIMSGKVSGKEGSLQGVSVYIEGTYDGTSTNDKRSNILTPPDMIITVGPLIAG